RLEAAEHARRPIRHRVHALDVVGARKVQALLRNRLALVSEQRCGLVSEYLLQIRAQFLDRHDLLRPRILAPGIGSPAPPWRPPSRRSAASPPPQRRRRATRVSPGAVV